MTSTSAPGCFFIVSKTWDFCNTLPDEGVGYEDELAVEIIEDLGVGRFREVVNSLNRK
jgi:hypothetical protein